MIFRGVVFDLDGTLIDSIEDLASSMNTVLESRGLPVHRVEAYRGFIGRGMGRLVFQALPEDCREEETIRECILAMQVEYAKHWQDSTDLFPGVAELLRGLENRGLALAVHSNKPHEFTRLMVDSLLDEWSFSAVLGARPERPVKPDPAGALEIADALGLYPEECLFVGDSDVDMDTAVQAGMYPVGALWGYRDRDELLEAGAGMLIDQPEDILDFIDETDSEG
ncbi:MAG: HAD family hydrolase [Deltaproteobacteria bacterium]|nr:HAD family hydrolase [Deltaproteobacteria bacterium]